MSQREINVELTVLGDVDVLIFLLDDGDPEKYCINLNNATSQAEIKLVFSKLLELLIDEEIKLRLTIAEGYTKTLYKEVCVEYISDLNREIIQVKELLKQELK